VLEHEKDINCNYGDNGIYGKWFNSMGDRGARATTDKSKA
jgi:hypothetical protein